MRHNFAIYVEGLMEVIIMLFVFLKYKWGYIRFSHDAWRTTHDDGRRQIAWFRKTKIVKFMSISTILYKNSAFRPTFAYVIDA